MEPKRDFSLAISLQLGDWWDGGRVDYKNAYARMHRWRGKEVSRIRRQTGEPRPRRRD